MEGIRKKGQDFFQSGFVAKANIGIQEEFF